MGPCNIMGLIPESDTGYCIGAGCDLRRASSRDSGSTQMSIHTSSPPDSCTRYIYRVIFESLLSTIHQEYYTIPGLQSFDIGGCYTGLL